MAKKVVKNKKTQQPTALKANAIKKESFWGKYKTYIVVSALVIISYFCFKPSFENHFTNWDDPKYVYESNLIKELSKENVKTIFTTFIVSNYHPLTILSLAWDYKSAKLKPEQIPQGFDKNFTERYQSHSDAYVYHRTSVYIHLLNVVLVFIFVFLLSRNKLFVATFVTFVFALHPMHVESVSWIAERKDVLFMFFYTAGLITYLLYQRKSNILLYLATVVLAVLSMFSKPAGITFPIVLLLIDYLEKRNFDYKLILDKVLLLIASAIFGVLLLKAQVGEAVASIETFTIWQRIMFASYSFMQYIYKLFLPINLSAFYPYPDVHNLPIIYWLSPFIVLAFIGGIYLINKFSRLYVFGILFYFVNIIMIMQFISVGRAIISDRYTYLPYIGLAYILAMEAYRLIANKNIKLNIYKYMLYTALLVYSISFIFITYNRTKVWFNNETLWTDVINKYPEADVSYKNRGNHYAREALDYEKAMVDYNKYIELNKTDALIFSNRGNLHGLMGDKFKEGGDNNKAKSEYLTAINDYAQALIIQPNSPDVFVNRGITYLKLQNFEKSLADFNKALTISEDKYSVYRNRANCYLEMGKFDLSIQDFNTIMAMVPDDPTIFFLRAIAYFNKGDYRKAIEDNTQAIALRPNYPEAYKNRSITYNQLKDFGNALNDALKAKEMGANIDNNYLAQLQKLK